LVPTIAFLLVLPALIALGFWQLDRAEQKRELQQQYDERSRNAPISLGAQVRDAEDLRYFRVTARGVYDVRHQFFVDNRVHDGMVGYYVVSPLIIADSDTVVLVNRGWIRGNPDRSVLPDARPPAGIQNVTGVAVIPLAKVFRLAEEMPIGDTWPKVWQRIDMNRFGSAVKQPLHTIVILQEPGNKDGELVRDWKRLDTGIAVHQGYAFQWFSLALALASIFFLVNYRHANRGDN
jgi:surfeit locus 1 family protein